MAQDKSIPWCESRENGFYYANWYDPNTRHIRRQSLRTKDSIAAAAAFAEWLIEFTNIKAGRAVDHSGMTVAMALDDFERERIHKKHADVGRGLLTLKWLRAAFSDRTIASLTPHDIEGYCADRAAGKIGRPSGNGTQRRELATLIAAINHQVKSRRLAKSDVPYLGEIPEESPPRDQWLRRHELAALFEACKQVHPRKNRMSPIYRFVVLAYYTAARRRSIEQLTWFQVDLDLGIIRLNPPGRKQTSKRRPDVPISPLLMPILKEMYEQRINSYVLDSPKDVRLYVQRAARKVGLGHLLPHTLRRTRATHLAQDGVPIYEIANLLGDTIATTEKSYLKFCPSHMAATMAADLKRRDKLE